MHACCSQLKKFHPLCVPTTRYLTDWALEQCGNSFKEAMELLQQQYSDMHKQLSGGKERHRQSLDAPPAAAVAATTLHRDPAQQGSGGGQAPEVVVVVVEEPTAQQQGQGQGRQGMSPQGSQGLHMPHMATVVADAIASFTARGSAAVELAQSLQAYALRAQAHPLGSGAAAPGGTAAPVPETPGLSDHPGILGPVTALQDEIARDATMWQRGVLATPPLVHGLLGALALLADRLTGFKV